MTTDSKMEQARIISFWELLKLNKAEIPKLQRDYAQGRSEEDDEHAYNTGKEFLKKLLDTIFPLGNSKHITLNFVYVNPKVDSKDEEVVEIIDGQQRLTTLYLIHWYLAIRRSGGKFDDDSEERQLLSNFTYETRYIAGLFCEHLIKDVSLDFSKDIVDQITSNYWFFTEFERDATISSMLNMIKQIHEALKEKDDTEINKAFDILTGNSDNSPITFMYMDLDDLGMTDELYIKMNARGKPLTEFESFKAKLKDYLLRNDPENSFFSDVIKLINGEWSNFFWLEKYRSIDSCEKDEATGKEIPKYSITFDTQIAKAFRFLMYGEYVSCFDYSDVPDQRKHLKEINEKSFYLFTDSFFKDFPNRSSCDDKNEVFHLICNFLNATIASENETGDIITVPQNEYDKEFCDAPARFKELIGAGKLFDKTEDLSTPYRFIFYGYVLFIALFSIEGSFNQFAELEEWMRIVYNIGNNTLYEHHDELAKLLKWEYDFLNGLKKSGDNVRHYLAYEYTIDNGVTQQYQIEEEQLKAKLLLNSTKYNWKELIKKAEQGYLDGQIRCLFEFSGVNLDPSNNILFENGEEDSFNRFKVYIDKMDLVFCSKDSISEELLENEIMRRALLTFDHSDGSYYMLTNSNGKTCDFLSPSGKDGFRKLLRISAYDSEPQKKKRLIFKEFLDSIQSTSIDKLVLELKELINNFDESEYQEEDGVRRYAWRKHLVKSDILYSDVLGNNEKYIYIDDDISEKRYDVSLFERRYTNCMQRELFSYVLYLNAKDKISNLEYYKDSLVSSKKYAHFKNNENIEYKVYFGWNESDLNFGYYITKTNPDVDETDVGREDFVKSFDTMKGTIDYLLTL